MSIRNEIKKIFKAAGLQTNPKIDEAVVDEMIKAQRISVSEEPSRRINVWRIIVQRPLAKFAVAAVIIVAVGLLLTHHSRNKRAEKPEIAQTLKSPAEMLTIASLNLAYRRGGMEAAEQQSRKALKLVCIVNPDVKKLQKELINNDGI